MQALDARWNRCAGLRHKATPHEHYTRVPLFRACTDGGAWACVDGAGASSELREHGSFFPVLKCDTVRSGVAWFGVDGAGSDTACRAFQCRCAGERLSMSLVPV